MMKRKLTPSPHGVICLSLVLEQALLFVLLSTKLPTLLRRVLVRLGDALLVRALGGEGGGPD